MSVSNQYALISTTRKRREERSSLEIQNIWSRDHIKMQFNSSVICFSLYDHRLVTFVANTPCEYDLLVTTVQMYKQ